MSFLGIIGRLKRTIRRAIVGFVHVELNWAKLILRLVRRIEGFFCLVECQIVLNRRRSWLVYATLLREVILMYELLCWKNLLLKVISFSVIRSVFLLHRTQ